MLEMKDQSQDQAQMPQDQEEEGNLLTVSPDDAIKELLGGSYDKFKGEDGKIDTAKLAKSYAGLEKKLGSGDIAPDSPEGYGMPESMPDGMDADTLDLKGLYADLHKAGATKKVVDVVTQKYIDLIKAGKEHDEASPARAAETLKAQWGAEFEQNVKLAQKAFYKIADDEDKANVGELGKSVQVMKLLAKIGKGMQEDSPAAAQGNPLPQADLQSMMKSEAYWNPKHPDHLKTKEIVTRHFNAKNA